jgi:hypothetical protein
MILPAAGFEMQLDSVYRKHETLFQPQGNVWKKFEKVNNKPCMGRNTDGKIRGNTYGKDR